MGMSFLASKIFVSIVVFQFCIGRTESLEYQVSTNFLPGTTDFLINFLPYEYLNKIYSHGCWCQHFDPSSDIPAFGTMRSIDRLDELCKRWITQRKDLECGDVWKLYKIYQKDDKIKCLDKAVTHSCEHRVCSVDTQFGNRLLREIKQMGRNSSKGFEPFQANKQLCKPQGKISMTMAMLNTHITHSPRGKRM